MIKQILIFALFAPFFVSAATQSEIDSSRSLFDAAQAVAKDQHEWALSQIPIDPPDPVDSDGDGVTDDIDQCPGTPAGASVDANGCEIVIDTDGDGIPDNTDACPNDASNTCNDPPPTTGLPSAGLTLHSVKNDAGGFDYPVNTGTAPGGNQTYIVRLKTGDTLPGSTSLASGWQKNIGSRFAFFYTRYVWQFQYTSNYSADFLFQTSSATSDNPKLNTDYLLVFTSDNNAHTLTAYNLVDGTNVTTSDTRDYSALNLSGYPYIPESGGVDVAWSAHWSRTLTDQELSDILTAEGNGSVVVVDPTPDPTPDPVGNLRDPVNDAEIVAAIIAAAPAQHPTEARFAKIAGSEIDVLVGSNEFAYCSTIACYASYLAFMDWTGGAWNFVDWEMLQPAGGGHADYGGNEAYLAELKLDDNNALAVKWSRPIDPQPLLQGDCGAPVSGPVASHTYASPLFIESTGEYWHATTGGWPATVECSGISKAEGQGQWVTDKQSWRKVGSVYTSYGRACYHRNADKIYFQQNTTSDGSDFYTFDPSDNYSYTVTDNAFWLSTNDGFDSAMDQQRDICYWYNDHSGISGYHFDPVTGERSTVFNSTDKVIFVSSLSVEHSTGNLVIVDAGGSVKHLDISTNVLSDISATAGDIMIAPIPTARNIYGKFEMIEKIPCVGIALIDAREGVYLMTLPASVCSMQVAWEPITIDEAVAQGLVPEYQDLGYAVTVKTPVNMTGAGGERPEIGLLMEYQAALIATRDESLKKKLLS